MKANQIAYEHYKKVSRVIHSCENKEQLLNARKLIRFFFDRTKNGNFTTMLRGVYADKKLYSNIKC